MYLSLNQTITRTIQENSSRGRDSPGVYFNFVWQGVPCVSRVPPLVPLYLQAFHTSYPFASSVPPGLRLLWSGCLHRGGKLVCKRNECCSQESPPRICWVFAICRVFASPLVSLPLLLVARPSKSQHYIAPVGWRFITWIACRHKTTLSNESIPLSGGASVGIGLTHCEATTRPPYACT